MIEDLERDPEDFGPCAVTLLGHSWGALVAMELALGQPVRAITPGQSGVLYARDDEQMLGGGVIE